MSSASLLTCSGCCCSVVFAFPCLQSLAPADVAVHLTLLATACSVFESWSVGEARVRIGEYRSQDLSRSGRSCLHQPNVYVRDLDLLAPNVLDARRLEIIAKGVPIFGVLNSRFTQRWSLRITVTELPNLAAQWRRIGGGSSPKGSHLPRACGAAKQSQVGGSGTGSWRQVVQRDCHVLDVVGSRQSSQ